MAGSFTFEAAGFSFQGERLDAISQLILWTKIGPLLTEADPAVRAFKDRASLLAEGGEATGDVLKSLGPFAAALARMPDDVQRSIYRGLLSKVYVKDGLGALPLWNPQTDSIAYAELDNINIIPVLKASFLENFKRFLGDSALGQAFLGALTNLASKPSNSPTDSPSP